MINFPRHHHYSGLLALGLALALPLVVWAEEATLVVTKIDGSQLIGELINWNAAEITLQTTDETVTLGAPQLLRMRSKRDGPMRASEGSFLKLVDGTRLPLGAYAAADGVATVTSSLSERSFELSTEIVEFVQLTADMEAWDPSEHEAEGDVLVIRNKAGALDQLTGVIGDVSPEQVNFAWDGEAIPVKRSKVAALVYFHTRQPDFRQPVCWLNLQGGARLPVVEISMTDQRINVRTTNDLQFSISLASIFDADYSQGKLAYLSDLKPIEQRWTPRIGLPSSAKLIAKHGLPRRDQSFAGSALSLRWPPSKTGAIDGELKTYEKGLAMRSRTEIRYRLPQGMRRFATLAGIDPETLDQGNVSLEIFADRVSLWHGEIDGESAPVEINVVLGDARELRIVVDYGENLDFGDRLHLAEARVSQ